MYIGHAQDHKHPYNREITTGSRSKQPGNVSESRGAATVFTWFPENTGYWPVSVYFRPGIRVLAPWQPGIPASWHTGILATWHTGILAIWLKVSFLARKHSYSRGNLAKFRQIYRILRLFYRTSRLFQAILGHFQAIFTVLLGQFRPFQANFSCFMAKNSHFSKNLSNTA